MTHDEIYTGNRFDGFPLCTSKDHNSFDLGILEFLSRTLKEFCNTQDYTQVFKFGLNIPYSFEGDLYALVDHFSKIAYRIFCNGTFPTKILTMIYPDFFTLIVITCPVKPHGFAKVRDVVSSKWHETLTNLCGGGFSDIFDDHKQKFFPSQVRNGVAVSKNDFTKLSRVFLWLSYVARFGYSFYPKEWLVI